MDSHERRALPEGWKIVKLGEFSNVFNGKTPSKNEQREKGHPILKIKDIKENGCFIGIFDSFVDDNFFEDNKFKCIKEGDTLILNAAHNSEYVGSKSCYISSFQNNVIPTGEWLIIRSNSELFNNRFKHFLLISNLIKINIKGIVKGIHLYPKDVKNLEIPLPPLPTQRHIVSILEKAEETKRLRAQADELTDRLLQSVFIEMFGNPIRNQKGWEIKTLGDVCTSIKDGPHVSPNYVEDGIPFISVHNIINGFFNMEDIKYISYEDHKEYCKRCKPEKGDVLYSKGGTTGFAKRVDVDFDFSIWVHLALLKFPKEIINPIFLETCLNSNYCKVQAKINTRGIANKDLVLGRMATIKIILPPLPLQQKFARIVEKVEAMRQAQNQSQQEIDNLFKTLMQKSFKGELTA